MQYLYNFMQHLSGFSGCWCDAYRTCCSIICMWFSHYQIIRMKFPNLSTRRLGTRGQSKYVLSVNLCTSGMIMCAQEYCYVSFQNFHPLKVHLAFIFLQWVLIFMYISVYYWTHDSSHPLSLRYHYYGLSIKETSIYYRSVYSKKGLTRYITAVKQRVTNTVWK